MKTKTLTIDLRARKYHAVHETAAFEAIIKVARMANAFGIALEATHKVFGGKTGRYAALTRQSLNGVPPMYHSGMVRYSRKDKG